MQVIKLFLELSKGALFHYYDTPMLKNVKSDDTHYVGIFGLKKIHPHVLVVEEKVEVPKIIKIIEET